MRRIVENLGLNWGSQRDKLTASGEKFRCTDIGTTGTDGKTYQMLAMPVRKLPRAVPPSKRIQSSRSHTMASSPPSTRAALSMWRTRSMGILCEKYRPVFARRSSSVSLNPRA